MAPITAASDENNHQALLDKLDVYAIHKPFRKATWKSAVRRNKNVKQIISEASRKEASALATQNNSGISTPMAEMVVGDGSHSNPPTSSHPNIAQAAQHLSTMVLARNMQKTTSLGPTVTYTNIESAPSLHPSSQRRYCDITGLSGPYTDPKTRLRYHNGEIYAVLSMLGPGMSESYLGARGAHTVLK